MNIPKEYHARVVPMMTLIVADDIYIEIVPVLEHVIVGHSMSHHIVHRGTYTLRKMHVVYGARISIMRNNEIVDEFIDII
jgi:hypothetical protein